MKHTWILDAGHGGINSNGEYTTDPKIGKRWKFEDGLEILEGVTNRLITDQLYKEMERLGIEYRLVYDSVFDLPLTSRVNMANKVQSKVGNSIYLSLHSNAGHGKGFEVFTSPGQTKSDLYASKLIDIYKAEFPEYPMRPDIVDGDQDKEAKFYVLVNTSMPAVLVENLFFDTRDEAEFLLSATGRNRIVNALVKFITQIENDKVL